MSSSKEGGNSMSAVVDMSKKKKNRGPSAEKETEEVPAENLPYSVVDKKKKKENSGNQNETPMEPMGDAISNETAAAVATGGYNRFDNKCMSPVPVKSKVVLLAAIAFVFGALVFLCFAISSLAIAEVSSLKSEVSSLKSEVSSLKSEVSSLKSEVSSLKSEVSSLKSEVPSLKSKVSSLQRALVSHETDVINSFMMLYAVLGDVLPGQHAAFAANSCAALPPSSPSGYYWVRASNGSAVRVYCDMTRSCGNITGGWVRVAELDMRNSSHQCPSGFTQHNTPNIYLYDIRTCRRMESSGGCLSVLINIPYSYWRVCGRVIAYQVGTTNAFAQRSDPTLEDNYVDGVSLTHGEPRQHVWTFAAGLQEDGSAHSISTCPCTTNSGTIRPPNFVGNDYFCEAGTQVNTLPATIITEYDPLWDGFDCYPSNPCCSFNNPPWFYKQLPQPTTDDLEMRVCRDEDVSNEDIALESVEIYVW